MIPVPNPILVLIIPEKISDTMKAGDIELEKSELQKEKEKRAQTRGTIFAVGDDVKFWKKGDLVSVYRNAVTEITEDGVEYFSINHQNILCKFVSHVQK
jgi:co-chaperonin GroES (HSP10)